MTWKLDITTRFGESEKLRMEWLEKQKKDEAWKEEARRCVLMLFLKRDFLSLIYLLGYRDIGQVHLGEIERMEKQVIKTGISIQRLWLWARGHFKTSIVTVADTVRLVVNVPDIRILITSNTIDISKKMVGEVKEHFVSNEMFRRVFREWCPTVNSVGKVEFGNLESFTVLNRVKILKEPTVMCSGYGTNLTGLHFDWIKADDLVTRDSVTNDTQIEQSREQFASLRSLFNNPEVPKIDVVGTPYHFADVYAQIRKTHFYDKSIIPVKNENGEIAFKERFTETGIEALINDPMVGPFEFSTQYMLNPIDPASAKFKEEWWQEYERLPEGCSEYICVDPASTQKKRSDYTVIERWGRDHRGDDYLIEGIRDKLTVFQRMDKIVEVARRCRRLAKVRYESLGGRHGDLETLQKRFLDEHISIIPSETKAGTAGKKDRIEQRLVPRFHARKIFMPRSLICRSEYDGKIYDFVQLYKLEFLQHPMNEHDDILDCHAQMYEEPFKIESGIEVGRRVENKGVTADQWDKFYKDQTRVVKGNPFWSREKVMDEMKKKRIRRVLARAVR